MTTKLTKKQALIIEFISDYTGSHGVSPTYREIMTALGLSSVSAVAEHIDNLVKKRALKKVPGAARRRGDEGGAGAESERGEWERDPRRRGGW